MRKLINFGFSGTTEALETPREKEHRLVAREAAEESFVLLKNEGVLPISTDTPIALYGRGACKTIKGGTGSGDVNERHSVTIYEGLQSYGYNITSKDWLDSYNDEFDEKRMAWRNDILDRFEKKGCDFFNIYAQTPFYAPAGPEVTKTDADVAIYVLSRVCGEGADRNLIKGDYYLSDEESEVLHTICSLYKEVVLVINSGNVVDLSFMDEEWANNINAVFLFGQAGMEGGNAFARVLSGEVCPSGKLTDTWPLNYEDYPNAMEFSHLNGDVSKELYGDGIFVGYRFFDSFNVPVRYGFGYGLGYTNFSVQYLSSELVMGTGDGFGDNGDRRVNINDAVLKIAANVKNTGIYDCKEVVQVYVSLPVGAIDKEYRRLGGFAKTKLLKPGEEQEISVNISLYNLTSYDEEKCAYVLEHGTYGVFLGNSLSDATLVSALNVEVDEVFCVTEHVCEMKEELSELILPTDIANKLYENVQAQIANSKIPTVKLESGLIKTKKVIYTDDLYEAASMENDPVLHEAEEFVKGLSTEELVLLAMGDPLRQHDGQLGAAGSSVPGSAGETNHIAEDKGLAGIPLVDGPAGLRLAKKYKVHEGKVQYLPFLSALENGYFYDEIEQPGDAYYQYCTAIPVGVGMAQTWNQDLVAKVGQIVGDEMLWLGVTLWLAPGMNIHRNPLCGRNFEYYSEDPLLTGKIAGAMTEGVQRNAGVGTTIKHFCGNNAEDNRNHNNSVMSEKTLREIYLKGFEIAVKETQPMSIMTSYNLVNGVHTANSHDLCTKVLRNEWGFKGLIMTDWMTTHEDPLSTAAGCLRAGNDIIMPGEMSDVENIRSELQAGTLEEEKLKECMTRLVCTIFKSNYYEGAVPYTETLK